MNEVLNGTNPTADARLLADIDAADPFDGGCPADCEPRTSVQAAIVAQTKPPATSYTAYQDRLQALSTELGVQSCITYLCKMDMWTAADTLKAAHARGEVVK